MSSREHPKHDQAEALAPPHPVGRRLRSAFIKFATHFPYNAKVCLNGHHYAQQQAHAAGITFPSRRSTTASCPPTTQPGSSGSATTSGHERIDTFSPADGTGRVPPAAQRVHHHDLRQLLAPCSGLTRAH